MQKMIQLDFFEDTDDLSLLKKEIISLKQSSDKVRKGMFVRHNELSKMYMEILNRLEIIERNICKL